MANVAASSQGASDMRRYCILGTAGHIDHGKSALVKALTGTDPDRLPEEQERGMTIVLGFAELRLPSLDGGSDLHVGIVDVPGHERFVRTMVAGATGIDLGMLVVAADDGVMPQTREHVEILDLLGVKAGLIAINKVDIAHAERIEAVRRDITALVQSTSLQDWPVAPVSAKTGQGLEGLRATIGRLITQLPPRAVSSVFRMAIDRVFTIRGRGTVVTGSVLEGQAAAGQTLELQPAGLTCKVREVQSHGAAVQNIGASQRAALNLTGIEREQIERGMELATPGYLTPSRYVDAKVRVLARRDKPLFSHTRVSVSMGTTDTFATVVVVGASQLSPSEEGLAQLRFHRPVVAAFGQRFILRTPSWQATIGGGRVVRPVSRRIRQTHPEELAALKLADSSDPDVRFEEAVRLAGFESPSAVRLACEAGVQPDQAAAFMERLQHDARLAALGGVKVHQTVLEDVQGRALSYLKRHHAAHPTEPGVLRDRFIGWLDKRTAPGLGKSLYEKLLSARLVIGQGPYAAHHEFRPALSSEDAALLEKLAAELETAGFDPPDWPSLKTTAGLSKQRSKMLEDLAKCDARLTLLAPGRYIAASAVARAKEIARKLAMSRPFKLAEVRDELGLSRRVVQPLLEYLDRIQFTRRVGDERVLQEGDK